MYIYMKMGFHMKVYGAFRISVKMLLMWNSKIQIDGGEDSMTTTSVLEIRNLIVLTVSFLESFSLVPVMLKVVQLIQ